MRLFVLLQIIWGSLATAAYLTGWLQMLIMEDTTRITWGLVVLFVLGNLLLAVRQYTWVEYLAATLPPLGLLGTLIGIKIAVGGQGTDDASMQSLGVAVALNTTIVGVTGSLWLLLCERLLKRDA